MRNSEQHDVRFPGMIPGWRQVPFNLSGASEPRPTQIRECDSVARRDERESRSSRNGYDHRLRESQLNRPQIRTHASVVPPIFLLRSYYRETVFSALRQLQLSLRTQEFPEDSICACYSERRIDKL